MKKSCSNQFWSRTVVRLPGESFAPGFFLVASSLNAREREIGTLRTAGFTQCSYEIAQHRWLGAEAGLSGEEIEAIDSGREQHWNQGDTALLAFVDELLHSGTIGETVDDDLEWLLSMTHDVLSCSPWSGFIGCWPGF